MRKTDLVRPNSVTGMIGPLFTLKEEELAKLALLTGNEKQRDKFSIKWTPIWNASHPLLDHLQPTEKSFRW